MCRYLLLQVLHVCFVNIYVSEVFFLPRIFVGFLSVKGRRKVSKWRHVHVCYTSLLLSRRQTLGQNSSVHGRVFVALERRFLTNRHESTEKLLWVCFFFFCPRGLTSRGGDVTVYVCDINQPSLSTPFYSILEFLFVFMALSTYFIP